MGNLRVLLLIGATSLVMACNLPLFAPATQPVEFPSATPTHPEFPTIAITPSFTPLPGASPTVTLIPTPNTPEVTPNSVNVNCRRGPDVAYDAVSVLIFGASTQVAGRNEDSSWWYVHDPSNPGAFCWIAASVVTLSGPLGAIPFVQPPAAIVTRVTVDVALPSSVACGGPNAVTFTGKITTNGSAKVKYQWEVTGDKNNTTPPQTLNFAAAGTKNAVDPGAYTVDCGKYIITLHILSPNDVAASKKFKVAAP